MNRAALLAQLIEHQSAIAAHMANSQALIAQTNPDPVEVANARWRLTRLLTAYQMFKHQQIFDPIKRHGSAPAAIRATEMKIACIAMGECFRSYLGKWTLIGVDGRIAEYRCEATGMVKKLNNHIARERLGIESLLPAERIAA